MKTTIFLSGLPRTGSTVLASMLNQHPDIHATTTSPVADLISITINNWNDISGAVLDQPPEQYGNILGAIISGSHKHIEKNIIVDKNRLWPRFSPELYGATGQKPKIICTVRDIPDILASYILLLQKNPGNNFIDDLVAEQKLAANTKNRCKVLLEKVVNHPYTSLKIGHNSNTCDILYLDYADIVGDGQNTVDKVCDFIGCNRYVLDTENLQRMDENDQYHGGLMGLHEVRAVLRKTSMPPENILGYELTQFYRNMHLEFWKKERRNQPIVAGKNGRQSSTTTKDKNLPGVPDFLEGDSLDYDLLYRAAFEAVSTGGLFCEIGVRRGGSLKHIIDAIDAFNPDGIINLIAIDPYGNIDYNATEQFRGKLDYTNSMKNESLPNIYSYVNNKKINLVFFNLEDTEFFSRFEYGVPVYNDNKQVLDNYSFVFFDGPHDVKSIEVELDFFMPKVCSGGVFVFDDIATYPHQTIHERLLASGFVVLEVGKEGRKISYRYTGVNTNKLH